MKFVIVLAALCAVVMSQNTAHSTIHREVQAIMTAHAHYTVDQCATACDEAFQLVIPADETAVDVACRTECEHFVNKVDHTHPPA